MISFARTDTSLVARWWWTVDRWTLAAILLLMTVGMILVVAASPPVATRLGYEPLHFIQRQGIFIGPALLTLIGVSMLPPDQVRRFAQFAFVAGILLMLAALLVGTPVNGARRWINIIGFPFQPSELVKPTFAVVTAWLLSQRQQAANWRYGASAFALLVTVLGLLAMQPDIGMASLIAMAFFVQLFLAGLRLRWVGGAVAVGAVLLGAAYLLLPHVTARIDGFLSPKSGENYQVQTALSALSTGGAWGRGPGEGVIKNVLPDAHTDFIFAVAGEEFGMIVCLLIVGAFAFVVLRGFARLVHEHDYFVLLATAGLLSQIGMQAAVNMGVNLRMLPAKGMTLPFISYGGSSLLALAAAMGMVLALTRRRTSPQEARWILGRGLA